MLPQFANVNLTTITKQTTLYLVETTRDHNNAIMHIELVGADI